MAAPFPQPLDEPGEPSAPPLWLYYTDPARAATEFLLLFAASPFKPQLPPGDGHPVLVLPGFMAGDGSTWTLRHLLRDLGYRVHGWHLGRNLGPTASTITGMQHRLEDLNAQYGAPISVIGWSLGGIYARTLARRTPSAVRQVITLGSPFRLTDQCQSRASSAVERYSHLHVAHVEALLDHDDDGVPVPATSIYSRFDGIVAWQACLDLPSPQTENIAVVGSHIGLGHHPAVIWAVADRLALPLGEWAPFRPPFALWPLYPPVATSPGRSPRTFRRIQHKPARRAQVDDASGA